MALEKPSPVYPLPSDTQLLAAMRQFIKPGLGFSASSCHLLARLGTGGLYVASPSTRSAGVHASNLHIRRNASSSTFTFPLTSTLTSQCSGLPGQRND